MRHKPAFRPTVVESLEERLALSHVMAAGPLAGFLGPVQSAVRGSGQAVTTLYAPAIFGGGSITELNGSVTMPKVGWFRMNGYVAQRAATPGQPSFGQVTLSNNRGTITLTVQGSPFNPTASGLVPLTFTITSATGAYSDIPAAGTVTGTGTLSLGSFGPGGPHALRPQPQTVGKFALRFEQQTLLNPQPSSPPPAPPIPPIPVFPPITTPA